MGFTAFMKKTLDFLALLLKAPEGTFLFLEDRMLVGNYQRDVLIAGRRFSICLTVPEDRNDIVLRQAVNTVQEVLKEASIYLDPNQGKDEFFPANKVSWMTPEAFAERLTGIISDRIFNWGEMVTGIHLPYISLLAAMFYEADASVGKIAFLNENLSAESLCQLHQIVCPVLTPAAPIRLERGQLASIRKYFAGIGNDGLLFIRENDGKYVLFGHIKEKFLPYVPVLVDIQGQENWCLKFNGNTIFRAKAECVYCLKDILGYQIDRLKKELGDREITALEPAIRAIAEQKHGTSVVFLNLTQDAAKFKMESLLLHGRAVRVDGLQVTDFSTEKERIESLSALKNLTRVDGALVIDYPRGDVAYTGAILDGESIVMGDGAAGARRNVISCFVANLALRNRSAMNGPVDVAALMFSENGEIRIARASDYCWRRQNSFWQNVRQHIRVRHARSSPKRNTRSQIAQRRLKRYIMQSGGKHIKRGRYGAKYR